MHIFICIYTKKRSILIIDNIVCMSCFKSESLGTRQPINVIFFREDHLSYFDLSSFVSKSLGRVEASELFPIQIVMFTNVVLIDFFFGLSCWQDFIDIASNVYRLQKLIAQFLNLWLHSHPTLSSPSFSEP